MSSSLLPVSLALSVIFGVGYGNLIKIECTSGRNSGSCAPTFVKVGNGGCCNCASPPVPAQPPMQHETQAQPMQESSPDFQGGASGSYNDFTTAGSFNSEGDFVTESGNYESPNPYVSNGQYNQNPFGPHNSETTTPDSLDLDDGNTVRLYLHKDYDFLVFETPLSDSKCIDLPEYTEEAWVRQQISSVKPGGHCVQLFEELGCKGRSVRVTPTSEYRHHLGKIDFNDETSSIQSCD